MKKKVPETSLESYRQVTNQMLSDHHSKIIEALSKLKAANYEQIAIHSRLDKTAIGRRLSELEVKGLVYKPGIKTLTSTGRNSFVYQLTADGINYSPTPVEKAIKGNSISHFSKKIQSIQQASLF